VISGKLFWLLNIFC